MSKNKIIFRFLQTVFIFALFLFVPKLVSADFSVYTSFNSNQINYGDTGYFYWSTGGVADDCDVWIEQYPNTSWSYLGNFSGSYGSYSNVFYYDKWFRVRCTDRQSWSNDEEHTVVSAELHVNPVITMSETHNQVDSFDHYSVDPNSMVQIYYAPSVNANNGCQFIQPFSEVANGPGYGTRNIYPGDNGYPGTSYVAYTITCYTSGGSVGEKTIYIKQNQTPSAVINYLRINGQNSANLTVGGTATMSWDADAGVSYCTSKTTDSNGNETGNVSGWSSSLTKPISSGGQSITINESPGIYYLVLSCNPEASVTINVAASPLAVLNVKSSGAWNGSTPDGVTINSVSGSSLGGNTGSCDSVACYYTKTNSTTMSGTIHAVSPDAGSNASFQAWTGDCSGGGDCTITVNPGQVKQVDANYSGGTPPPGPTTPPGGTAVLQVNSYPSGGVAMSAYSSCTVSDNNGFGCGGVTPYTRNYSSANNGTQHIRALASYNSVAFNSWVGCDSATGVDCTITPVIGQTKTITANYGTPSNGSDLIATNLVVTAGPGQVYLDSAVKNIGTNPPGGSSWARLWLDWNNNGTWDFQNFSGQSVGNLAAGATQTLGRWTLVPPAGPNKYRVCADNDGAIPESDETNNCADIVFDTTSSDLIVSAITLNPTDCADSPTTCSIGGQNSTISAVLKNQGGQSTTYAFGYSYSLDIYNNGSWDQSGSNRTGYIDPGQTRSIGPLFSLTLPVGTHKIYVCADNVGEIAEGDETNNCTTKIINVTASVQPMVYHLTSTKPTVTLTKGSAPSDTQTINKILDSGTPASTDISLGGEWPVSGVSVAYDGFRLCSPTCSTVLTFTATPAAVPRDYAIYVNGIPDSGNTPAFTLRVNAGIGGLNGTNPTVSGTAPGVTGSLGTFVCNGAGTGAPKAYLRTPTTYSVTATGGIAPYTYYWTVGSAAEVSSGSTNSYVVTYDTLGSKTVSARFVDSEGSTGTCTFSPNVGVVFNPNIGEF